MIKLSAREARRVALAATGLAGRRPSGLPAVVDRLRVLQIDSVNVAVRAHEMPTYSRAGPYDRAALARHAYGKRAMFEYWGHEAAYVDMDLYPVFRHRMDAAAEFRGVYHGWIALARDRADFVEAIYAQVAERGPVAASALEEPGRRKGSWWSWGAAKRTLEWLFLIGRVTAHSRATSFERLYDITERVIPAEVLARPTLPEADARAHLLLQSADALGVATEDDLLDYFRQHRPTTRPILQELVAAGHLLPVEVEGWTKPAFTNERWATERPSRATARTLLSPFDPVVWYRPRAERLFDFHYRIEIYVPAPKRVYGYYVMPFLLGDRLVARVDVKADRQRRVLSIPGAFAEPGVALPEVAAELAAELRRMATWLGLDDVEIGDRGDLGPLVRAAL